MGSRYTSYQAFIDDVSAEAGEGSGALDTVLLNLLKSVVDTFNTIRGEFRQATGSIALVASTYNYTISSSLSDYVELVDKQTGLRLSNGLFVPIAKSRLQFLNGWSPTSQTGPPTLARIFAGVLYVRPTPSAADTMTAEYYKRLATPALSGTVLIPDEYLTAFRADLLSRLEGYHEADTMVAKQAVFQAMKQQAINLINRDYCQNVLPSSIVSEDDDL